jgi:multicomponent K+:H+ antiporter subunit D
VLGIAFFVAAVAIVGLPPLSGFLGKLMVLQAVAGAPHGPVTWFVVLGSGFLVLINLARIGGQLFWETRDEPVSPGAQAIAPGRAVAAALLLLASPLLTAFAGPVAGYARAAAEQLHAPGAYVAGVLGGSGAGRDIRRTSVPR